MTEFEAGPPQQPALDDPDLFAPPPAWPKVIGIISIIYSALLLTCTSLGVGILLLSKGIMEPLHEGAPPPPSIQLGVFDWGLVILGLALLIMLLCAGITTIMRKPLGRLLHLVYAGVSIPNAMVASWQQMNKRAAMEVWANNHPDTQMAQQFSGGGGQIEAIIGLAFTLVFGLGFPLFLLVWFGLVKTKPSDMLGGVEEVY